jgi:hypothetical protein
MTSFVSWIWNTVADVLLEPEDPSLERKDISEIAEERIEPSELTQSPPSVSFSSPSIPAESMSELEFTEQRSELIRTFSFDERPPVILTGVKEGVELILTHDLAEKVPLCSDL